MESYYCFAFSGVFFFFLQIKSAAGNNKTCDYVAAANVKQQRQGQFLKKKRISSIVNKSKSATGAYI